MLAALILSSGLIVLKVNGEVVLQVRCRSPRNCSLQGTTASTSGLPTARRVSLDYYDKMPFKFNGTTVARSKLTCYPNFSVAVTDFTWED
jgi:hypothetical protein